MKMRELERRTGVNREVIRVLFRKGLLPEPRRLARNAAEYDEAHVRAIATVRALQSNDRLTLNEIKDAIAGLGPDRPSGSSSYHRLEELLILRFDVDRSSLVPIATLIDRNPEADRDARAFAAMRMLTIVATDNGPSLSLTDARLVEIWGKIRQAGFVEETGFPPENISFYQEAAEMVAAHEAAVFISGSAGRISEDHAAAMLHEALPLMLSFFGLLRTKAFIRNISRIDVN